MNTQRDLEEDTLESRSTNGRHEESRENLPVTDVLQLNRNEVSDFSTVTGATNGITVKLNKMQRRRVILYLKEEGWKKHKFAIKVKQNPHILFKVNPKLLEDLYFRCGIAQQMEENFKLPLMIAFEAGLATTRSNKIQAIKTKYIGTYESHFHQMNKCMADSTPCVCVVL
jgi:hypothetical protein